MRVLRLAGVAFAVALAGPLACGGEDQRRLVDPPPPPGNPAALLGTWEARQPGGYMLRYVFRPDGTYTHVSGGSVKRRHGTYRFGITARGTATVRGRRLVLRPRSGTIERHDPEDRGGDFKRPVDTSPQRYQWSVRGTGRRARLTLALGGSLAVTYRRR